MGPTYKTHHNENCIILILQSDGCCQISFTHWRFHHMSLMALLFPSHWPCSVRASLTFNRQPAAFLDTCTTASGLQSTIPCHLRALIKLSWHLNASLMTWALSLYYQLCMVSTITLPSWSESFPHTSLTVWVLPFHFSHGLRASHLHPSRSEYFLNTSLMAWGLPSYFPHCLKAFLTIYRQYEATLTLPTCS